MILVVGAAGEEEYGHVFSDWAANWRSLAEESGIPVQVIGLNPVISHSDRETLRMALEEVPRESSSPLWLILIGHGTFNEQVAKFNLTGPDITPAELSEWLNPIQRTVIVVHAFSASGPFIPELSREGRILLTATRSGNEENFSRLGGRLALAWRDPDADRDQDGQVTLLEAWLQAARDIEDFYSENGRLLTEHTLLDDNGDGLGTPADWYQGLRARKTPEKGKGLDGMKAHQAVLILSAREIRLGRLGRIRRDELEIELEALRIQRPVLGDPAYYAEIEKIMLELAEIYRGSKNEVETPIQEPSNQEEDRNENDEP